MPEKLPNPDKIKEEKERIKEEVQVFKERTEGLNPEIFGVPGEEGLEEEKEEIPKEMLFAYELEEKIAEYVEKVEPIKETILKEIESNLWEGTTYEWYTRLAIYSLSSLINSPIWIRVNKQIRERLITKMGLSMMTAWRLVKSDLNIGKASQGNKSALQAIITFSSFVRSPLWSLVGRDDELTKKAKLIKNRALKEIESNLDKGQDNQESAWYAIIGLSAFINTSLWLEIDKEKQEQLIRKMLLVKNSFLKEMESHLDENQIDSEDSWYIIRDISTLTTLKNYLLKVANRKLKEQERQKALHPEKDIPPRPEFLTF